MQAPKIRYCSAQYNTLRHYLVPMLENFVDALSWRTFSKKQMGSDRYTISYNLQLDMGAYVLILETGKEHRLFRMMVL